MARWLNICSKCGHKLEVDLVEGKCPSCGAASWLCHLLDQPARPRPLPDPNFVTEQTDALIRQNGCNKIQRRVNGAGRPPVDIPLEKVMAMHAKGMTLRAIGDNLGVSHMTVKRILAGQKVLPGI